MIVQQLEMADFDLVEVKNTPHCKKHGAMNKVSKDGIWRCIAVTGFQIIKNGNSISRKELEGICRAGCVEINLI